MPIIETPLNREEFIKLLNASMETIHYFDPLNNNVMENKYTMFLSNGEVVDFNLNENNIPHLLGFTNIEQLINSKKGFYYGLKEIVENKKERLKTLDRIDRLGAHYELLMSKHWQVKIDNIKNQTTAPYPVNVLFVCKYNPSLNYTSGETVDKYKDCEYYIARKNDKGDILLLGLAKGRASNYFPRTSRIILKDNISDELPMFLKNQVLCFVNSLQVVNYRNNYDVKTYLDKNARMDKLQELKLISEETGASIDCSQDYLHDLRKRIKGNVSKSALKGILSTVSSSISKGVLVELEESDLEDVSDYEKEISNLVISVNDKLCVVSKNDTVKVKYSQLKKQKEKVEVENRKLVSDLSKSQDKNLSLENEIKRLKKEKEELEQYKRKAEKKLLKLENVNIDE